MTNNMRGKSAFYKQVLLYWDLFKYMSVLETTKQSRGTN